MIHLRKKSYPYMEEINEGVLRQFQRPGMPAGQVLDVGCGRGQLGEAIRALGWKVWGVELSEEACATARTRLDRLIEVNLLDFPRIREEVGDTRFDVLIFSDVLEHLYDPLQVLEEYLPCVRPGGKLIISVPNGLAWTNRIQFLCGRFRYTDTGLMDRTHIRFFTFRTARELVRAAGCTIDRSDCTPYLVRAALPMIKKVIGSPGGNGTADPRALIDSKPYRTYMKYVYPVEYLVASLWRPMFAFRIILVATKPS